jgi:hypothetical protein
MDILSDYRITALTASDSELARRAEHVRVALERAPHRPTLRERLGLRETFDYRETTTAPCTTVTP